jgi:hypothetical protein
MNKNKVWGIIGIFILLLMGVFAIGIIGTGVKYEKQTPNFSNALKFDVISTEKLGNGSMVRIKVKITNITSKDIYNAQATCVLFDKGGKEVGFAKHYVIKGLDGGLNAGGSDYFTFVVDDNSRSAVSQRFKVASIRFK